MTAAVRIRLVTGVIAVLMALPGNALAQRSGGASGGSGASLQSRLDQLTAMFTLDKDQKNQVKKMLDDAHKKAAPVRQQLGAARAAIAAAIDAGKSSADIEATLTTYGTQATAMAAEEMKALTAIVGLLTPEQRANAAAVQGAVYFMRGIFIDDKKWNVVPDGRGY